MLALDDPTSDNRPCASVHDVPTTDGAIVSESYFIRSGDPGIKLYVRNKRALSTPHFDHRNVVLYVHGSPEPAENSFDLRLSGPSWMDHLAARGFDAYFVNLRGHGRSTRLSAMSLPAVEGDSCLTSTEAGRDFAAAIDHILRRRNLTRLSLIGWSRGCVTVGVFAEERPDTVHKIVMIAPSYPLASPSQGGGAAIEPRTYAAYDRQAAMERWLKGVPAEARPDFVPAAWIDKWWQASLQADPVGARRRPPVYRGPLGWYQFAEEYRRSGKPFFYDPGRIRNPVLLLAGQWDLVSPAAGCQALFDALTLAPGKQFIPFGGGTHYMHRERVGSGLIRAAATFLAEG